LVLFDIDGTLISPGDGAKVALSKTIFNNFGIEVKVTYENTAGKTDRWIMKDILINAGIDEKYIDGKMNKVINDYWAN
jgi:beta-phosphoglucomutase-like phosphatase (HAD superfamily)